MKRLLYLATAALVASLLLAPAAMAQDDMMMGQGSGSQTLQLTPSRNSGVSGTAVLTETAGGVQVQLNMQGLPQDGVSHLAHIHSRPHVVHPISRRVAGGIGDPGQHAGGRGTLGLPRDAHRDRRYGGGVAPGDR